MIIIKNIKKSFGSKRVLKGISFDIRDGETVVIVGCSGCGKTVLLRSIIGLEKPDTGRILIDGEDITILNRKDLYRIRKKFGMLFQGAALFDSLTIEENVGLALHEHTSLSRNEIQDRVVAVLESVGLVNILNRRTSELSGGMKKRVGLARALILNPQYVLFDEPTTGLDPIMAENITDLINETTNRYNITSIVVTHDMNSAMSLGDRIVMICDGKIVFEGSGSDFKASTLPYIMQFRTGNSDS
ncbi:MAG: ABC transporter ATP-binding protein [Bacteroidetes bacterium RBG_13_42_15]|nr:MAG: ABC transporter ATP-binding protein [Bacteroidetes bacterium RBG_13_42_15]HJX70296.1 ABC transporter ATP-binding protein [Bacteroidales bacterium]